ncbi:MAG: ABC transporter permease [Hyphomicrobiales bacterium]|nr:ABC transporter permease [Hyphomicrobiales bacterium]
MIRFILADLRRLWAGSLVVALLVALATALGVTVTLDERALRLGSARAADSFDLVVGAAGSETQLVLSSVFLQPAPLPLMSGEILARLAQDPRVVWAAPVGFGDSYEGYSIVGTTLPLVDAAGGDRPIEGRRFAALGEAVIGSEVRLGLGSIIKPMHGLVDAGGQTHTELAYTVVGRSPPAGTPWDRAILVPIEAVWAIHGMHDADHDADEDEHTEEEAGHGTAATEPLGGPWNAETPGIPAVLVKPKTVADAYRLRQEYRSDTTLAVFPGEVLTRLYTTLGDARKVLTWVAAGSQGLVAAAVALIAIVHVGQRRRQIGALRALGAPQAAIFGIVWLEIFALVAVGVAAGFLVGYGAARFIADRFTGESGIILPVGFNAADFALAVILLLVAAALAAVPAALAYRQSAASALRI